MLPGRDKYFTISQNDSSPIKVNYINTNKGIIFAILILCFVEIGLIPFGMFSSDTSVGIWILLLLPESIIILILCFVPHRLRVTINHTQKTIELCNSCCIPKIYEGSSKTYRKDEIQRFSINKFNNLGKRYYEIYVHTKSGKSDKIIYGQDTSCSMTFDPWLDEIPIQLEEWLNEIK